MIKKAAIVTAGVVLLLALMFGSNLIPYAQTAYQKIHDQVNNAVPVEYQLETARNELKKVESEFRGMLHQIAREKVAIDGLEQKLASQQEELDRQYANIMTLRDHLESGETQFVVANRSYSKSRVKEDLRNRFKNYKTVEATVQKTKEILDMRRQSLDAAITKLETMKADRHALELEIENLAARNQMLDVAKSASNLRIDDSKLSQTGQMIDEIKARLDVEEEMLSLTPKYNGGIPMDGETIEGEGDILEEVDSYFSKQESDMVAK